MIHDTTNANLYTYIDLIRTRPGMYIGGLSVTMLRQHLDGYVAACCWKGINEPLESPWHVFHDCVRERTGFRRKHQRLLKYAAFPLRWG